MRRWEVLLVVVGVVLLVWLGQIWLGQQPTPPPPVTVSNHCRPSPPLPTRSTATGINLRAPVAANGAPLPATVQEDVVLDITDASGQPISWWLDWSSRNWLLDYPDSGFRRQLCLVDQHYFFYNFEEGVWDEVDPRLLDGSILDLVDTDRYLLAADQLTDFRAVATAGPDEPCLPHVCAVWLASSLESDDQIRIRVNKQTRKVYDVLIIGPQGQTSVIYYYQPVVIQIPEPVRYLPVEL